MHWLWRACLPDGGNEDRDDLWAKPQGKRRSPEMNNRKRGRLGWPCPPPDGGNKARRRGPMEGAADGPGDGIFAGRLLCKTHTPGGVPGISEGAAGRLTGLAGGSAPAGPGKGIPAGSGFCRAGKGNLAGSNFCGAGKGNPAGSNFWGAGKGNPCSETPLAIHPGFRQPPRFFRNAQNGSQNPAGVGNRQERGWKDCMGKGNTRERLWPFF